MPSIMHTNVWGNTTDVMARDGSRRTDRDEGEMSHDEEEKDTDKDQDCGDKERLMTSCLGRSSPRERMM